MTRHAPPAPLRIATLDRLSDPGAVDRANEDALALGQMGAAVLDGATGLGAPLLADGASDAAWLAGLAAAEFERSLDADEPAAAVVERVNAAAAAALGDAGVDLAATPRWAWPTAGFQWLRPAGDGLETAGLGDCGLILLHADGAVERASGLDAGARAAEQASARTALAATGGLGAASGALRHPDVVARLRADRETRNRPGGIWTLGPAPGAGGHVLARRLAPRTPALALLATDGFLDLVDLFAVETAASLVRAAADRGLAPLCAELRRLEREVDPDGRRYPRFKRSDDATAILLRITRTASAEADAPASES